MAVVDKNVEKAFDFAQEATKQLIALATGVLTITLTFLTDVIKKAPNATVVWLHVAWVMYLVSIVFGVFVLLNLSGVLERPGVDEANRELTPSIYRASIRLFSIAQILGFLAAIALTLVFGFKAA
jgi:hypothetical protein